MDAQFGFGAHRALPPDLSIEHSRRTGRIRTVRDGDGVLLGTQRPDGGIAVSMRLAALMASHMGRRRGGGGGIGACCVHVSTEAAPFVTEGRSVFCRHVVRCGRRVRAQSDVLVMHDADVIAVGRALLSCEVMSAMSRGVAVKVRDSLKGRGA